MQAKTHSRPVWADFRQKLQCIWNPVWVSGEQALGLGRGFPLRCSTRVTPTSSSIQGNSPCAMDASVFMCYILIFLSC